MICKFKVMRNQTLPKCKKCQLKEEVDIEKCRLRLTVIKLDEKRRSNE